MKNITNKIQTEKQLKGRGLISGTGRRYYYLGENPEKLQEIWQYHKKDRYKLIYEKEK